MEGGGGGAGAGGGGGGVAAATKTLAGSTRITDSLRCRRGTRDIYPLPDDVAELNVLG